LYIQLKSTCQGAQRRKGEKWKWIEVIEELVVMDVSMFVT
jgi:hypothetical protein